jgi:glycosyltransferase involved in cell wall biosynthesis
MINSSSGELPEGAGERTGWPWGPPDRPAAPVPVAFPRISVVIPSFNQGRHIEAAIRSVLLQGYPDVELIIMDGGSTDETVSIIRKYEPWIADWISAPDRGQSHAICEGMHRSTGEICAWIGCDDIYLPGALLRVGRYFAEQPGCEWLAGSGVLDFPASGRRGTMHSRVDGVPALQSFWRWGSDCFVVSASAFWRRRLWDVVGGLREDLHYAMDYDLWLRFAERTSLHRIDDVLSAAIRDSGGKSFEHRDRAWAEVIRCAYEFAGRESMGRAAITLGFLGWYVRQRLRDGKTHVEQRDFAAAMRDAQRLLMAPFLLARARDRVALMSH